jgi:diamine N-acetyltransferase
MEVLRGQKILLRLLEPTDLEAVYRIENNESFWNIGDTRAPFSLKTIQEYVANAKQDINEVQQLRLAICDVQTGRLVGLLDLFDFDAYHSRAGVGILIEHEEDRKKGFGAESVALLKTYAKKILGLHQLYANILEDNVASISLFEKQDFVRIGVKKDWRREGHEFKNELVYQHLL